MPRAALLRGTHAAAEIPARHALRFEFEHHFAVDAREQPAAQPRIAVAQIALGQCLEHVARIARERLARDRFADVYRALYAGLI